MLRLLYRRLLHRNDNLGWRGLLGLRRMPPLPVREALPHPFDVAHGTETGGYQPGEALGTGSESDLYNTAYYAISPSTLRDALVRIPVDFGEYTFVDLGCGKGRALLVATELPFARIVGVEIAPALCGVARRNNARDARVSVLNSDAASMVYPSGPLVVFLYHPFLKPVVRQALLNLERQVEADPRPVWLLYANCTYDRLLARFRFLGLVWDLSLPLSDEDRAADRHGTTHERYTLFRAALPVRD